MNRLGRLGRHLARSSATSSIGGSAAVSTGHNVQDVHGPHVESTMTPNAECGAHRNTGMQTIQARAPTPRAECQAMRHTSRNAVWRAMASKSASAVSNRQSCRRQTAAIRQSIVPG